MAMSSPVQLIVVHLGEFGIKDYSNFLGAAFQLAVVELSASNLHSSLDEESITASLLGAFAVATPICASAFSLTYVVSSSWVRYSKNLTNGMAEKDKLNAAARDPRVLTHFAEIAELATKTASKIR